MKRSTLCLLAALVGLAYADEKDPEALAKSLYESAVKVVEVMEGIKDKEGAEKAKAQLAKHFEEAQRVEKEFRALSAEGRKKLEEKWRPKLDALKDRFQKEGERLSKDEAIRKVLADVGPFKAVVDAKVAAARLQVAQIDQALKAYFLANGKYPRALDELEKGDRPFIEKGKLKDPWGKAYQFDPDGAKNKGLHPDVWTVDPSGKTIGNWLERPAPPRDK
jgi:hypothetical protein